LEPGLRNSLRNTLDILNTKLANNGKFAAIDQAVISLSNFSASLLLTSLVSPTELGTYVLGFLAIYLVRAVQNGLIIQPLNTFGAGKSEGAFKAYFSAAALHQLILALLSAAGAAILGWVLTRLGNDTLGPTVFALWFSFFSWQTQEFLRRAFYTRGEVGKAVWVSLVGNFVRILIILGLSQRVEITGLTGLNAIGWGGVFGTFIGIWLAKAYFTTKWQDPFQVWLENWRFGRWILGASLADWMVVDMYPILMAGMVSFAATGVYQTLQNLVAPIHVLLRAMDTFVTPILAKSFDQDGIAKLQRNFRMIYVAVGIPVLGLLVLVLNFTPQLLFLLKGDTYLPYANGIYLMALFYFFLYVNRPLQMVFRAVRQGKQVFMANILAMVSMFSAGIWLIGRWGVYGAIAGQALNAIIISLVLGIAWINYVRRAKSKASSV
jgi:O-antigen/teichoic acid export membrane protein